MTGTATRRGWLSYLGYVDFVILNYSCARWTRRAVRRLSADLFGSLGKLNHIVGASSHSRPGVTLFPCWSVSYGDLCDDLDRVLVPVPKSAESQSWPFEINATRTTPSITSTSGFSYPVPKEISWWIARCTGCDRFWGKQEAWCLDLCIDNTKRAPSTWGVNFEDTI
jgi:hypothetical protein